MRVSTTAGMVVFAVFASLTTQANATSAKDLQVIARLISFMENGPKGTVEVAVVDGAGADAAIAAFGGGVAAGPVTLKAKKVAASALAGSGAKVILVPEGQAANQAAVAAAAKALGALSISTDKSCAESGKCVASVQSDPKVEIVVNRAAATASKVSFQSAFRVMIKEL